MSRRIIKHKQVSVAGNNMNFLANSYMGRSPKVPEKLLYRIHSKRYAEQDYLTYKSAMQEMMIVAL
jgi:hypothetical protein